MKEQNKTRFIHIVGMSVLLIIVSIYILLKTISNPPPILNEQNSFIETSTPMDISQVIEKSEPHSEIDMIPYTNAIYDNVDLYDLSVDELNTISRDIMMNLIAITYEEENPPRYVLTNKEKEMISVTAWNADHTDDESLACCIQVILNRAFESNKFPNTVEKILRASGQFETCDKVLSDKKLYDYDYIEKIINKVCDGYDPFDGELAIFYASKNTQPHKIARNLYLIKECGGSKFWGQE
jgi:hypothetical protein